MSNDKDENLVSFLSGQDHFGKSGQNRLCKVLYAMNVLRCEILNVVIDPPTLSVSDAHHLLINVDGDLKLYVNEQLVFSGNINFIEFIDSLKSWCADDAKSSYSFDSSDFEEKGIIQFVQKGNSYQFDSCWGNLLVGVELHFDDILSLSKELYASTQRILINEFKIDIREYGI